VGGLDYMTPWRDFETFVGQHRFVIAYDGQCPFCSAYIRLLRLEAAVGRVDMFDARKHPELVQYLRANGYEINEGMVAIINGDIYFGERAMHVLALHTTRSGMFNSLTSRVFASPLLSKIFYPAFKIGRRFVLFALGRTRI
jgi:predicted DCC family thiol-disulfide oxidoreductase YuxK